MDKALKQRLVGASVLIILAVIVLPMLLSGSSDRLKQESRKIELPPKPEELSIESRRFPVGVPGKPSPNIRQETTSAEQAETREPVQVDKVAVVSSDKESVTEQATEVIQNVVVNEEVDDPKIDESPDTETAPGSTVEAKPAVTSITLSSSRPKNLDVDEAGSASQDTPRYLVQVGSFSSEKNANELASRLKVAGFPVLMDVVDRTAGRLHRVRIGPYAERSEADVAISGIGSKIDGLAPRVVDLRPRDSAPVSAPADPLVRWVVQVGSFSNVKSADALVSKLRLSGFTAFSEKVSSSSSTVYKVRVGPELDRDKALGLARKLKQKHNLDGFVTTQE